MDAWSSELGDLRAANWHIEQATKRVLDQAERVRVLEAAGFDSVEASRLLANMWNGLICMYMHRRLIKDRLRAVDGFKPFAVEMYPASRERRIERLAIRAMRRAARAAGKPTPTDLPSGK
jgi:hypothetical protein